LVWERPFVAGADKKAGNKAEAVAAAGVVFRDYGGFIRAVIRFQGGRRFETEDLFQGFFLVLVRKPVPPEVRNVKSFLYRSIVNYILDLVRKNASYRRNLQEYAEKARILINNRPAGNAFVKVTERSTMITHLAHMLQNREAEAFVLKYRDNYTLAEIAAAMGVDRRTVSRYLSAGLRKLRENAASE
jgi:RNA polymerase sigma factor (sigma-70 family)